MQARFTNGMPAASARAAKPTALGTLMAWAGRRPASTTPAPLPLHHSTTPPRSPLPCWSRYSLSPPPYMNTGRTFSAITYDNNDTPVHSMQCRLLCSIQGLDVCCCSYTQAALPLARRNRCTDASPIQVLSGCGNARLTILLAVCGAAERGPLDPCDAHIQVGAAT